MEAEDAALRACICEAFSGPRRIPVNAGLQRSAITALGVHCLFVHAGFVPQDAKTKAKPLRELFSLMFGGASRARDYRPPEYWLALLPSPEFMFRYTYPGKCGTFVVHCSVKLETEQMFVHASEDGNPDNIQIVGLLVGYTVPESAKDRLRQRDSWEGVFSDLSTLIFNVETYLLEPLLRRALDEREFTSRMEDGRITWNLGNGWIKYGALIIMLGFITASILKKRAERS